MAQEPVSFGSQPQKHVRESPCLTDPPPGERNLDRADVIKSRIYLTRNIWIMKWGDLICSICSVMCNLFSPPPGSGRGPASTGFAAVFIEADVADPITGIERACYCRLGLDIASIDTPKYRTFELSIYRIECVSPSTPWNPLCFCCVERRLRCIKYRDRVYKLPRLSVSYRALDYSTLQYPIYYTININIIMRVVFVGVVVACCAGG